jgi:signal peptidase
VISRPCKVEILAINIFFERKREVTLKNKITMFKQFLKQTPFGISAIALCTALFFLALLVPVFGRHALIVRSGSMEPAISTGDLITIAPSSSYQQGDIVTFKNPQNKSVLITHRIVLINTKEGTTTYRTKGDANSAVDNFIVPSQNVIGKADHSIMQVGRFLAFAKTKTGFLTFAAIPTGLVILLELNNILKEVKKSKKHSAKVIYRQTLKTLYHHYGKPMGVPHSSASYQSLKDSLSQWSKTTSWNIGRHININSRGISLRTLLPLIAVLLVAGNTYALYQDSGSSTDNVFTAASVFPTSSSSPNLNVTINEFVAHAGPNNHEWVEFYNPNHTDLSGYYLDDDTDFLSDALSANIKNLSTLNNTNPTYPYLEFNNFLNNPGDHVVLFDSTGNIVDQYQYTSDPSADISIGRTVDGSGTFTSCGVVTKGGTNNSLC